jgi:outer membrane protein assembly factor BamA
MPRMSFRAALNHICVACSLPLLIASAAHAQRPPATLHEIVIEGNTRTHRKVVERIIDISAGAPFDLKAMDRVWDRLEDCGYFAFVDLSTEIDDQGHVTLYVSLDEEKTARYTPYIRYSARHKYLLGGALRDINLRGRGEVLEVQAILTRIQRGHLAWSKPWLMDLDGLSLHVDAVWEKGPFVWRPFDYSQWHLRSSLRRNLSGSLYVQAGGGFEAFRQNDSYEWTEPDRGHDAASGTAQHPSETRDGWVLNGLLGLDTRDNPYYPRSGMFHEASWTRRTGDRCREATSYSTTLRAFLDLSVLPILPGRPVLALHAHGQTVDGPTSVEHGLFWGGAETVRGAPYARREGEHGYLLSAELRWPVFLMPVAVTGEVVGFGLHLFYDAGDAWFDGADPGRAMQSIGLGAHLSLLTWQLRFEAARERDHGWSFQFMDMFNF